MYILRNLRNMIKNSRLIFILLILCVAVSTLVIQFSYGIYQNYHVVIQKGSSETREIYLEINNTENEFLKLYNTTDSVRTFSPNLYNGIDYCVVGSRIAASDLSISYYFNYFSFDENGNFIDSETIKNNVLRSGGLAGRWFTNEDWEENKKVCVVGVGNDIQRIQPYNDENGEVFTIIHDGIVETNEFTDPFGETFKIVGVKDAITSFPINSASKNYKITDFVLCFKEPITKFQYEELKQKINDSLGGLVTVPELEIPDDGNTYLYRTIILICVLISIAAGINFIILFHYIMLKRRRMFAIFRLCGASSAKCTAICLFECLILSVPVYIISTLLYDKFITTRFGNFYPYMKAAGSLKIYIILGLIYIGITTLITMIMLIKNTSSVSVVSIEKGRD